jgi:hypothetical protein
MVFYDASGETNPMIYSRGGVAAVFFFLLTYAVALKFILLPARETGLVTVKETRTLDLPQDFATDPTVWNIVLVSRITHLTMLHLIA